MCLGCGTCTTHVYNAIEAAVNAHQAALRNESTNQAALRRQQLYKRTVPVLLQGKIPEPPRSELEQQEASESNRPDPEKSAMRIIYSQLDAARSEDLFGHKDPRTTLLQMNAAANDGAYPTDRPITTATPSYYPREGFPSRESMLAMNPTDRAALEKINRENQYPILREINLEDEKMRQKVFGYARDSLGRKTTVEELEQRRANTVHWTCPNCHCSYDLPA